MIFLYSTNFPNTNAGNTWSILEYFTKVCYVIYAAQQSARSINYKTTVHVSVIDTRVFIEGLNFNFSEKHCALSSQPLNPILRLVWYSITNENKFHLRCGLELPFVFVQNIFYTKKMKQFLYYKTNIWKCFKKNLHMQSPPAWWEIPINIEIVKPKNNSRVSSASSESK